MRYWPVDPDRRGLLSGLTLFGLFPGAVMGQEVDQVGPAPTLESNLVTRLALPVVINGEPAGLFVVDTGAGRTVLAEETAQHLGLEPARPVVLHGLTSAQVAPTVRIPRLSLARRRFLGLETPIIPMASLRADGLLGLDVLSHFRLAINVEDRIVDLRPPGNPTDVFAGGLLARRQPALHRRSARRGRFGQLILSQAEVEGRPCDVFVDTGAQHSIGNLALLETLGSDGAVPRQAVFGVTGQVLSAGVASVGDIRFAGRTLGPTRLLFADLHAFRVLDLMDRPALLAGADLIYRFRQVVLDFQRSELSFSGLRRLRPA